MRQGHGPGFDPFSVPVHFPEQQIFPEQSIMLHPMKHWPPSA